MSEESSCIPLWLLITICILAVVNLVMGIYYWYDWRFFSRREKLQKSKKNKEGETPTEGQTTGTGKQP
ncbi:unnamed protein product [Caenorhabditis brenneri]